MCTGESEVVQLEDFETVILACRYVDIVTIDL